MLNLAKIDTGTTLDAIAIAIRTGLRVVCGRTCVTNLRGVRVCLVCFTSAPTTKGRIGGESIHGLVILTPTMFEHQFHKP